MTDQPVPPAPTDTAEAALDTLERELTRLKTGETLSDQTIATLQAQVVTGKDALKAIYLEANTSAKALGMPLPRTDRRPYTPEEVKAMVAKLPSIPDVGKLTEERDAALARAEAAERRAESAERETAQLRSTKAAVQAEVTRVGTAVEEVEKLLK